MRGRRREAPGDRTARMAEMSGPRDGDLPIFVAWMDFLTWLLPTTAKLPKHIRFTLVNRIDNLALDVAEDLVEARYSRNKGSVLARANLRLEKRRVLLRLCHQLGYFPHARCEYAMGCVNEVGAMLGGWLKQQQVR